MTLKKDLKIKKIKMKELIFRIYIIIFIYICVDIQGLFHKIQKFKKKFKLSKYFL